MRGEAWAGSEADEECHGRGVSHPRGGGVGGSVGGSGGGVGGSGGGVGGSVGGSGGGVGGSVGGSGGGVGGSGGGVGGSGGGSSGGVGGSVGGSGGGVGGSVGGSGGGYRQQFMAENVIEIHMSASLFQQLPEQGFINSEDNIILSQSCGNMFAALNNSVQSVKFMGRGLDNGHIANTGNFLVIL
ncbi:uncharacterized protein LOC126981616 [Eriocheir sinensis]|uniref:uncharacterized protein LOC126981616 n=1 Tax=Eriocheir sinensis TaxID=95602 RepID=UPI0021C72FA3|nr:uncharacterized protein LOC126981616 [Eriocheir sinensis]